VHLFAASDLIPLFCRQKHKKDKTEAKAKQDKGKKDKEKKPKKEKADKKGNYTGGKKDRKNLDDEDLTGVRFLFFISPLCPALVALVKRHKCGWQTVSDQRWTAVTQAFNSDRVSFSVFPL
jgi:hypothetical protein